MIHHVAHYTSDNAEIVFENWVAVIAVLISINTSVTDVFIEISTAIIVDVVQERIRSELFYSKRHQFIKCVLCIQHTECNPEGSQRQWPSLSTEMTSLSCNVK